MNLNQYGFPVSSRKLCRPEKLEYAKRMRAMPTFPEALLWSRLSKNQKGYHFRRQAVILGWIVDFYCARVGLVIEVDGPYHETPEGLQRDHIREKAMWEHGFFTLRIKNADVVRDPDDVVGWIIEEVEKRAQTASFLSVEKRKAQEAQS